MIRFIKSLFKEAAEFPKIRDLLIGKGFTVAVQEAKRLPFLEEHDASKFPQVQQPIY